MIKLFVRENDGIKGKPYEGRPPFDDDPMLDGFDRMYWGYVDDWYGERWVYDAMLNPAGGGVDGEIYKTSKGKYLTLAYDYSQHVNNLSGADSDVWVDLDMARKWVEARVAAFWHILHDESLERML